MAVINRQTLKNYFKKGGVATEKHFMDLIDSSLNVVDDGISLKPKFGLKVNPLGNSTRLLSFFKKSTQNEPEFSIDLDHDKIKGLSIQGSGPTSLMKFTQKGHVGINTNQPDYELDVNGTAGIESRIGTYKTGMVPADGAWHDIATDLDGLNCFEIRANANGKVGSGYYSISHAIAASAFGGRFSRSKIRMTTAYYGSFLNKIIFRWTGSLHNYTLQVKTRRNYGIDPSSGEPYLIKYNVTNLK